MSNRPVYVRLGYLATIQSGITVDAGRAAGPDDVTLPYLRVANVQDGHLNLNAISEMRIPRAVARGFTLRRGDVLMTEGGDLDKLGRGTVWNDEIPGCLHQNHVFAVRPDQEKLLPEYLALVTQSSYARSYFERTGTKTTNLASTNSSKICDLRIPLVDLDEQRRIADFLDAETARIDRLVNLQQTVRSSVEARVYAQLDLKVDELTETYGAVPFRRMIWSMEQGTSPQCDSHPADADNWGVLKVSAVKSGTFWENENKQLPDDVPPERRYEIKHGDLLITRANTPKLVGAAAVARAPRKRLMLCDKIFRVVPTRDLLPDYLVLVSLGTRVRDMCAEASHGTSQSMANLKTEEIKRWPIPAAPIPVQEAVIKELSTAREHAAALTSAIDDQLQLLAERRQSLITAAVTGEISVTAAARMTSSLESLPVG
jgi:type I restriction enzyme S subunit